MPHGAGFADIPHTARHHLRLLCGVATLGIIRELRYRALAAGKDLDAVFDEFPALAAQFKELRPRLPDAARWHDSMPWMREELERWAEASTVTLPLNVVRSELGIAHAGLVAFAACGLADEDTRFASLLAGLQPHGARRPTVGLLFEFLHEEAADPWQLCGPLLEAELVHVANRDAPRADWELRVSAPIWDAACGVRSKQPMPGARLHEPSSFLPLGELILDDAVAAHVAELPALLRSGATSALLVRGSPGCERLEVIGAVARELGRSIIEVDGPPKPADEQARFLGPLCVLTHSLPVFALELAPGEMLELPAVPGYGGPIAAYVGPEGGITGRRAERAVTIVLDHDPPHRRLRHWRRALGGYSEPELVDLAEQVSLPGRYIRQAAELAAAYASLERRERIMRADVQQATRALGRRLLETLAERLEPAGGWEHLVVAGVTAGELRAVERRCRHREHLVDTMGSRLPGGLNRGVRVLFEGPSGTGKTLAARVLAAELGLDLYRVDLAAVVNKYIGETEKNLSRVLSRAEDLDVILLLDEGDALMTRRTDVRSANDRYANLETNYLLQRLDTYTGIIVVTTNAGGAIDSAFERRMDVVVQFHPPDAAQRQRLWQLHLPSAHALHADAAERTALRYALTGGQIRNAAVNATLLALARDEGCVCEHDVESSIQAEYRKAGAAFPQETWTPPADDTVAAFLDAVS